MNLKIKVFGALCALDVFEINGVVADSDDFVTQEDASPGTAEAYCCGDMRATPVQATSGVLEKYGITVDEYNEIAGKVAELLSFGSCGWCS